VRVRARTVMTSVNVSTAGLAQTIKAWSAHFLLKSVHGRHKPSCGTSSPKLNVCAAPPAIAAAWYQDAPATCTNARTSDDSAATKPTQA
jgi:hypothetical protein